jgi:DDE_Tnp_1-associated
LLKLENLARQRSSLSAAPAVLSCSAATSVKIRVGTGDCGRLLELLGRVPDPRLRRGIRHRLAGVLAVAAAAVLAGSRSVLAIAEWAAEAPQPVLAALGVSRHQRDCRFTGQGVVQAFGR